MRMTRPVPEALPWSSCTGSLAMGRIGRLSSTRSRRGPPSSCASCPGMDLARAPPAECTIEAYGAAVARALTRTGAAVGDPRGPQHGVPCGPGGQPVAARRRVRVGSSWTAAGSARAIPRRPSRPWPMNSQETATGDSCGSSSNRCSSLRATPLSPRRSSIARLRFPAGLGRTLMTDLAGWDAREVESALDSVRVPLLAIQSTTLDTARRAGFARTGPELTLARTGQCPRATRPPSRCCTGTATSRRSNWPMRSRP